MSLMLRKKCQPVLDRHGLSSYHAAVSHQGNSVLSIVGECGKPLVYLTGVVYSKSVPDTEEIDYSVELLEDWLNVYIKTVIDYITKAKAFSLLSEMPYTTKEYECKTTIYNGGNFNRIIYINNSYKITASEKGEITSFRRANKKILTVVGIKKLTFDTKKHDKAIKYLEDVNAYLAQKREVEKLKSDLSACKI